jgi:hypothetical protein
VNWLDFYLICFGVGGGFSLMALMGNTFHAPHVHLHHGGPAGGALNMGTISAFLLRCYSPACSDSWAPPWCSGL